MVSVSIQTKSEFHVIGVKTWISGADNSLFAEFWRKCHADGAIEQITKFNKEKESSVTKSAVLGLSCTENDPSVRSFYFYIGVETNEEKNQGYFEVVKVRSYTWAIFSSEGNDINALMDCEMYAWMDWLPKNDVYIHHNGPELEVYFQENKIEYWIPVREVKSKSEKQID